MPVSLDEAHGQGKAKSAKEGYGNRSGDLCKGTHVSSSSHHQTDWGGSVAAGAGVQMGPSKYCTVEHTAFDILSPRLGSVSPFAPFQPYARQKAGGVSL